MAINAPALWKPRARIMIPQAASPIAPTASWPKMIPYTARSAKALLGDDRTEHIEG